MTYCYFSYSSFLSLLDFVLLIASINASFGFKKFTAGLLEDFCKFPSSSDGRYLSAPIKGELIT
jgi:hypothetical protein